MYCARHSKIETNLKCGKCDKPICPKCTVQTPVGARCPDCAGRTRLPVFQVSAVDYLKATVIALGLAIGLGVLWVIIGPYLHGFSYLIAVFAGYVIGELVSLGVNRKRSRGLQIISGVSVVICFGVAVAFNAWLSLYALFALGIGVFLAVNRFR